MARKRSFEWFKFYPADWVEGTRNMTLEERGAYIDIICAQMMLEGKLQDDEKWISHHMHISTRKWRSVKQKLIDYQKISVEDGFIANSRCLKELDLLLNQTRNNAEPAPNQTRTSAEPDANQPRVAAENSEKLNKNNGGHVENGRLRARVLDKKIEDKKIRERVLSSEEDKSSPDDSQSTAAPPPGGSPSRQVDMFGGPPLDPAELKAAELRRKRDEKLAAERAEISAAFDAWNEFAAEYGLSVAVSLTDARRASLRQRLHEAGGLDGWKAALEKASHSAFLMGQKEGRGGDPFRMTLDFMLQKKSFTKLREGAYGNGAVHTKRFGGGSGFRYAPERDGQGSIPEWVRLDIENDERRERGEPLLELSDA